VVLVSRVDATLDRAMRYAGRIGAGDPVAVHLGRVSPSLGAQFWARYGRTLQFEPRRRGLVGWAHARARARRRRQDDGLIAIVVPEVGLGPGWWWSSRRGEALRSGAAVPAGAGMVVVRPPNAVGDGRSGEPGRHVAVVPVDTPDGSGGEQSELLRVAHLLEPDEVRRVPAAEGADDGAALLVGQVRSVRAAGADPVTVVLGGRPPGRWEQWRYRAPVLAARPAVPLPRDVAVALVPRPEP